MEILYILNTVVLGVILWRVNDGVKYIAHQLDLVAEIARDISAKTDELLRRN